MRHGAAARSTERNFYARGFPSQAFNFPYFPGINSKAGSGRQLDIHSFDRLGENSGSGDFAISECKMEVKVYRAAREVA